MQRPPYPPKKPTARRGGWIQTATGVRFYVVDPKPEDVRLRDIAVALAKLCRFGGHVPGNLIYSVAQHSVLVALSLPHHLRVQGLLHDAAEAYCVDIPRPLKRALVNYDVIEARIAACIGDRFGVELCELPPEVHEADERALWTEKRDLLVQSEALVWTDSGQRPPWMARITPWSVEDSTEAFFNLGIVLGLS
jgi:uncharacterized protein